VIWWIVAGIVVGGLVLLGLVVSAVLRRLRPLSRAMRRLRIRLEDGEKLQAGAADLQERATELQSLVERAQGRAEHLRTQRLRAR